MKRYFLFPKRATSLLVSVSFFVSNVIPAGAFPQKTYSNLAPQVEYKRFGAHQTDEDTFYITWALRELIAESVRSSAPDPFTTDQVITRGRVTMVFQRAGNACLCTIDGRQYRASISGNVARIGMNTDVIITAIRSSDAGDEGYSVSASGEQGSTGESAEGAVGSAQARMILPESIDELRELLMDRQVRRVQSGDEATVQEGVITSVTADETRGPVVEISFDGGQTVRLFLQYAASSLRVADETGAWRSLVWGRPAELTRQQPRAVASNAAEEAHRVWLETRRHLFGENVDDWLAEHNVRGTTDDVIAAAHHLLQDEEFRAVLADPEAEVPLEIIRFAVQHDEGLGTMHYDTFSSGLKRQAPAALKGRIPVIKYPVDGYISLMTTLHYPAMEAYLSSDEFGSAPAEDKLVLIVQKAREIGFPFESDDLVHIYSALPQGLPGGVPKKDVKKVGLLLHTFEQVRAALRDERVIAFLVSDEFRAMPPEDRLAALVETIQDANLPLESENLGQIHTALPREMPGGIDKRGIQKVGLPMRVFEQVRNALEDVRIGETLRSTEFAEMDPEDRLSFLVSAIRNAELPLESDNLGQIYTALPGELPGGIAKRAIRKISLPMRVFEQIRAALSDERVVAFLGSAEFARTDPEDRLVSLVTEIGAAGLPLDSDNLATIGTGLPQDLPGGVLRKDIRKVDLPMRVFKQVRAALNNASVVAFLRSEEFRTMDPGERLVSLVAAIEEARLPLESDHPGQIYTALPRELPGGVAKSEVRMVRLSMRVFDQVRAALRDERIVAFLGSDAFRQMSREDRLARLVMAIKDAQLPLDNDSLGQIYSALPRDLPGGVSKTDMQYVHLSLRVFGQLRTALGDARVTELLASAEFRAISPEERLPRLVSAIKSMGLLLEGDPPLEHLYTGLPSTIGDLTKSDFRMCSTIEVSADGAFASEIRGILAQASGEGSDVQSATGESAEAGDVIAQAAGESSERAAGETAHSTLFDDSLFPANPFASSRVPTREDDKRTMERLRRAIPEMFMTRVPSTQEAVDTIQRILSGLREAGVLAHPQMILYGSFADGRQSQISDLDIAFTPFGLDGFPAGTDFQPLNDLVTKILDQAGFKIWAKTGTLFMGTSPLNLDMVIENRSRGAFFTENRAVWLIDADGAERIDLDAATLARAETQGPAAESDVSEPAGESAETVRVTAASNERGVPEQNDEMYGPLASFEEAVRVLPGRISALLEEMGLTKTELAAADMLMNDVGVVYGDERGMSLITAHYHNHVHNLVVMYAMLLLAKETMPVSSRDAKAAFLAALFHDFHIRDRYDEKEARGTAALVSETIAQAADLLGQDSAIAGVPVAVTEERYGREIGYYRESFGQHVDLFLGDLSLGTIWPEIKTLILRTDFPSNAPCPFGFSAFQMRALAVRMEMDDRIMNRADMTLEEIRWWVSQEYETMRSDIAASGQGSEEDRAKAIAWAERQAGIENAYLIALGESCRSTPERRDFLQGLAYRLEKGADQAANYWAFEPRVVETEVIGGERGEGYPGLAVELPYVSAASTYPFFFVPQLLRGDILAILSSLPSGFGANFLRVNEYFMRISERSEKFQLTGEGVPVGQDWEARLYGTPSRTDFSLLERFRLAREGDGYVPRDEIALSRMPVGESAETVGANAQDESGSDYLTRPAPMTWQGYLEEAGSTDRSIEDLVGGPLGYRYLNRIKDITNPDNEDKTLLYVGAGADVSTALCLSDATRLIFVDLLPFYSEQRVPGDPRSAVELRRLTIERYLRGKADPAMSYAGTARLWDVGGAWPFLAQELVCMGATDIQVVQHGDTPNVFTVQFLWGNRKRTLIYVSRTNAEHMGEYEDIVREYGPVDYYLSKAGEYSDGLAPLSINTRQGQDMSTRIANGFLAPGGFMISDTTRILPVPEVLAGFDPIEDSALIAYESRGAVFGYGEYRNNGARSIVIYQKKDVAEGQGDEMAVDRWGEIVEQAAQVGEALAAVETEFLQGDDMRFIRAHIPDAPVPGARSLDVGNGYSAIPLYLALMGVDAYVAELGTREPPVLISRAKRFEPAIHEAGGRFVVHRVNATDLTPEHGYAYNSFDYITAIDLFGGFLANLGIFDPRALVFGNLRQEDENEAQAAAILRNMLLLVKDGGSIVLSDGNSGGVPLPVFDIFRAVAGDLGVVLDEGGVIGRSTTERTVVRKFVVHKDESRFVSSTQVAALPAMNTIEAIGFPLDEQEELSPRREAPAGRFEKVVLFFMEPAMGDMVEMVLKGTGRAAEIMRFRSTDTGEEMIAAAQQARDAGSPVDLFILDAAYGVPAYLGTVRETFPDVPVIVKNRAFRDMASFEGLDTALMQAMRAYGGIDPLSSWVESDEGDGLQDVLNRILARRAGGESAETVPFADESVAQFALRTAHTQRAVDTHERYQALYARGSVQPGQRIIIAQEMIAGGDAARLAEEVSGDILILPAEDIFLKLLAGEIGTENDTLILSADIYRQLEGERALTQRLHDTKRVVLDNYHFSYLEGAIGMARSFYAGDREHLREFYRRLTGADIAEADLDAYLRAGALTVELPLATELDGDHYRDLIERQYEFMKAA